MSRPGSGMVGALGLLLVTTGCFDSLVSEACVEGFAMSGGRCTAASVVTDGGLDGPLDADAPLDVLEDAPGDAAIDAPAPDAPPDALTCTAPDLTCAGVCIDPDTDPMNCGSCGHVCASGLCVAGGCEGDLPGQIVAIGHDFSAWNGAMARALGNAAALAPAPDLAIARWRGTSTSLVSASLTMALTTGLLVQAQAWHAVPWPTAPGPTALDLIDVVVIEPQAGAGDQSETAGVTWGPALAGFIDRGGVVIVLEGEGSSSYRFASGAGVFTTTTPVPVSGQRLVVTAPGDAIASQVVSPYLGAATTVAFPDLGTAVVATEDGRTVIFHTTRY